MWRILLLGMIGIACLGCQSSGVSLDVRSPAVASVVKPWGKVEILRRGSFVLPREAKISVAVIAEGHAPQESIVIDHLKQMLPHYLGHHQDVGSEPLMLNEAMERARAGNADFLLTLQLQHWPLGFVDPNASKCAEYRQKACNLSSESPNLRLVMEVYDTVNQRVVDVVKANATLGAQTWLNDDVSPLIADTLSRMLDSLSL